MRPRPYLRAYMAGIVVPTLMLLVIVSIDAFHRFYFEVSSQFVLGVPAAPLERAVLVPMAVVPNVWGLWNMVYVRVGRRGWPIGLHGATLVLFIMPAGLLLASALDVFTVQWQYALPMLPVGMALYYLAWKYLVAGLNAEVGIAPA